VLRVLDAKDVGMSGFQGISKGNPRFARSAKALIGM